MTQTNASIAVRTSADPIPAHTARAIDADLKAAGTEKWTREGKIDFHAIRVAYINFVFESNASAKETQTPARHSTLDLTMNVYDPDARRAAGRCGGEHRGEAGRWARVCTSGAPSSSWRRTRKCNPLK